MVLRDSSMLIITLGSSIGVLSFPLYGLTVEAGRSSGARNNHCVVFISLYPYVIIVQIYYGATTNSLCAKAFSS
jgi:hypothetical protein